MALIRWQPREFALEREINDLINQFWGGQETRTVSEWYPKIDVVEENDLFVLHAELPGLKREDIKVGFENQVLTIEGERKHEAEESGKQYFHRERVYGSFKRSFRLGTEVNTEKITAAYKDGILTVTLPKSEAVKPRQIDVAVS